MALDPYEYPEELYCTRCGIDVKSKIVDATSTFTDNDTGEDLIVTYKAAVCPVCGDVLCDRDKNIAFINALSDN